jgi:hypothetical protein
MVRDSMQLHFCGDEALFQFCYNKWAVSYKLFRRSEPAPSQYLNDANTDLTVRYLTDIEEKAQV